MMVMNMDRMIFMKKVNEYLESLDIDEEDKKLLMRKISSYVNTRSDLTERDFMFIKSVEVPSVLWRGF